MSRKYKRAQNHRRFVQMFFGAKVFSLPGLWRLRRAAYTRLFKAGSNLSLGHNVFIYRTHGLQGSVSIGSSVLMADYATVDYSGKVVIEDHVTISEGALVYSHDHDFYALSQRKSNSAIPRETTIQKGAWIGARAIILPGVTIGNNAVVGAGSIVTHDVKPFTVVAGNPAKLIHEIPEGEME